MALTAPGGITNSSSKSFSNLFGRISRDNYNRVVASQNTWEFNNSMKGPTLAVNRYPRFKSQTIGEIIRGTGLVR